MPDPVTPPAGGGTPDPNNPGQTTGTAPTPPVTPPANSFDPSKLTKEDFDKIYQDPNASKFLFDNPRFKELTTAAQKLKAIEDEKAKTDEAKLLEEKKYQELIAQKDAKLSELQTQVKKTAMDNAITLAAHKAGIQDAGDALALIDRTKITQNDDGTSTGVDEAITALVEAKPYLKNGTTTTQPSVGGGTNPVGGGQGTSPGIKRFKASEIQDHAFWKANEADILKALAANMVEDDLNYTR